MGMSCRKHPADQAKIYKKHTSDITSLQFPASPSDMEAEVFTHYEYHEYLKKQRYPVGNKFKVVVFNAMRGTYLEAIIARIQSTPELRDPDILLVSELDIGMARSGNRHVPKEIAKLLRLNYAFGVEFVELTLGDEQERQRLKEARNSIGLHGNAIFSRFPLKEIRVLRLARLYNWYEDFQKRIGSRIALVARISGTPLTVASVHLENATTPEGRGLQIEQVLKAIEGPALIGGDFNTLKPISEEPLFRILSEHGFQYKIANPLHMATTPEGRRLDWIFIRGIDVVAGSPAVVPATELNNPDQRISDHDFLKVEILIKRMPTRR